MSTAQPPAKPTRRQRARAAFAAAYARAQARPPTASPLASLTRLRPFQPQHAQGIVIASLFVIAALEWQLFQRFSLLWSLAFDPPGPSKKGHGGADDGGVSWDWAYE